MEKHIVVTTELKSRSNPNEFRKNSNQISNNHDLLNFVKKNTKLMYSFFDQGNKKKEKWELLLPLK